jgi:pimeloyl-ACP methyl ester carboxylesterase
MSIYVLVHGAFHGGWAWEKVAPLLEKEGHKVISPDLPGHGEDKTPVSQITLQAYTDTVCEILDEQPEPVILVGHSLGGISISTAAEARPEKVKTLVYLAALLQQDGETSTGVMSGDTESIAPQYAVMSEDNSTISIPIEGYKVVSYNTCSDEDVAWAAPFLVPEPTAPMSTPVHVTEERFGRVPRVYIETLLDKGVTPSLQKKMYTALPCQKVISMNTDHSPFLCAPRELADHLLAL